MKTYIVQQTKHQLRHNIGNHVFFKKKTSKCMGPLNDGKSNKLTKRTTKTEKNEKC